MSFPFSNIRMQFQLPSFSHNKMLLLVSVPHRHFAWLWLQPSLCFLRDSVSTFCQVKLQPVAVFTGVHAGLSQRNLHVGSSICSGWPTEPQTGVTLNGWQSRCIQGEGEQMSRQSVSIFRSMLSNGAVNVTLPLQPEAAQTAQLPRSCFRFTVKETFLNFNSNRGGGAQSSFLITEPNYRHTHSAACCDEQHAKIVSLSEKTTAIYHSDSP